MLINLLFTERLCSATPSQVVPRASRLHYAYIVWVEVNRGYERPGDKHVLDRESNITDIS